MVIGIIGENCSGKSTLANEIKKDLDAEVITGKDYLRMAKSENEAAALFKERLLKSVSGENIIYVISEPEHIKLLPDGAVRILVYADIDTIKERFKARMHGTSACSGSTAMPFRASRPWICSRRRSTWRRYAC